MIDLGKKVVTVMATLCVGIPMSIAIAGQAPAIAQSAVNNCPGTQLTPAEIEGILKVHNDARAEVGVAPLTWNCNIATFAQNYINKGVFEHNPNTNYGENLAALGDLDASVGREGAKLWYDEGEHWNNNTRSCATGKDCGHYTQMVWRDSTEIGCGVNRNGSADWGKAILLVCNYNPAGNVVGENGFESPY